ncbi:hypothetical protein C8F01DRAFT_1255762 [Mycena amicta]|nr:hypothetical protein C8F01DRAFT_1255762 [Mycena amicta]
MNPSNAVPPRADAGQGGPEQAPEAPRVDAEIAAQCETIVDSFRAEAISKARALAGITRALLAAQATLCFSNDAFGAAHTSYVGTLDDHERVQGQAAQQGHVRNPGPSSNGTPNEPQVERVEHPWTVEGTIYRAINPIVDSAAETHRITVMLLADCKGAKRSILSSVDIPAFPDSQWNNLLGCRPINFDVLLSGMFTTVVDEQRTEIIGHGVELSALGMWNPRARSPTSADALLFVYPHRRAKLDLYREFVSNLFTATDNRYHVHIIAFDRACRIRVAERRNMAFSNIGAFLDLKMALVDATGVGVVDQDRNPSSGLARSTKQNDPCNNWNSNRCTSGASCRHPGRHADGRTYAASVGARTTRQVLAVRAHRPKNNSFVKLHAGNGAVLVSVSLLPGILLRLDPSLARLCHDHSPYYTPAKELPWSEERLCHEHAIALGYAVDSNTFLTYTSALNSYLTFCKLHDRTVRAIDNRATPHKP